ncbi:unnamed protein product, partial [Iphiclides podalirius]
MLKRKFHLLYAWHNVELHVCKSSRRLGLAGSHRVCKAPTVLCAGKIVNYFNPTIKCGVQFATNKTYASLGAKSRANSTLKQQERRKRNRLSIPKEKVLCESAVLWPVGHLQHRHDQLL